MPAQLQFFDMAVSITPPTGHLEPLPITLGPNWQPNDIRLVLMSASATATAGGDETNLMMPIQPSDPPSGFSSAYTRNPGKDTHGVYYRRLATGDSDSSVYWTKPTGWRHFMFATLTVRGVSPTVNPTGGTLKVSHTGAATTATASSVSVPAAGAMVFFVGNVPAPYTTIPWPNWAVSVGVPSGWTNLVATDKSGDTFFQFGTDPSLVVVGKNFASSGSTGSVAFPTAQGSPAFAGLYVFLTPAADVSATIGAA